MLTFDNLPPLRQLTGQNMEPNFAKQFLRRRARRMNFLPGLVILLLVTASLVRAASFTASLDRDTITLGESATLTLKFEGDLPQTEPSLPDIPGLSIGSVFRNSINLDINGIPSSILSFTYTITPQHAGQFTIPALADNVGGRRLSTEPLKLTVTQPGAQSATGTSSDSRIAFVRLELPKKQVYSGETITADLQLYYRQDTQLARQPQLTSVPADGFTVGKIAADNQSQTQIGNYIYNVIPAKIALTATKAGTLSIGPVTVGLVLLVPSNNRQPDPMFDPFGMFRRNEQKPVSAATDMLEVKSLPLPEKNQPANFTGAVGDFTMAATAGPTTVTVGDPITVRVQISGHGALDAVTLPPQDAWHDFKTYPPTTKLETTDQFGFQGTKTFEQIISPQNADVHELPPLTFSFFNPDDGQYHTLTEPAVPLVVKAAGASPMPTLAVTQTPAPESQTPQDILPIKENPGTLEKQSSPLVVQPVFLAVQSMPVLAFFAAFIWRRRTDNLANNPRLRRQRAVAQIVRSGLSDLKKFAAANQPDEFFALLFRLLQEQLGERLDCPASAITENVIEEHSALRGAPQTTLASLRELFQLCNQARYAPVRGASELNSVAARLEQTLGELQEVQA
jgi:hypothetical protein